MFIVKMPKNYGLVSKLDYQVYDKLFRTARTKLSAKQCYGDQTGSNAVKIKFQSFIDKLHQDVYRVLECL